MEGYAKAHIVKTASSGMQLLELARHLHTMQHQQVASEKTMHCAVSQLAQQLKQHEQVQAKHTAQVAAQQHRLEQLHGMLADLQEQHQQQSADADEAQQHLAGIAGLMAAVQQQHETFCQQVDQLQMEHQQCHNQQHQLEEQLRDVQHEQQSCKDQQQQALQDLQQHLQELQNQQQNWHIEQQEALQQFQQDVQQQLQQSQHPDVCKNETLDTLQRQLDRQEKQHQEALLGMQQTKQLLESQVQALQEMCQQQVQALQAQSVTISSLQEQLSQLASQVEALQTHQMEQQNAVNVQQHELQQSVERLAADQQHPVLTQVALDDAVGAVERRMLHALRVQSEAAQQLMELRITTSYDRVQRDLSAVQHDVSAQLQQLIIDIQAAMVARQQEQQLGCLQTKPEQAPAGAVAQQLPAAPAIQERQQLVVANDQTIEVPCSSRRSSDLGAAHYDQQQALEPQDRQRIVRISAPVAAAAAERLRAVKAAIAASQQQPHFDGDALDSGLAGIDSVMPYTCRPAGQLDGMKTSSKSTKDCAAGQAQLPPSIDGRSGRKIRKNAASPGQSVADATASASRPVSHVLNEREVDVVLHLLGALHGVQG